MHQRVDLIFRPGPSDARPRVPGADGLRNEDFLISAMSPAFGRASWRSYSSATGPRHLRRSRAVQILTAICPRPQSSTPSARPFSCNPFPSCSVEIHGHVATLTLNSPPVNALTRTLNDELTRALDQISEIDDIRAVVLTGAGKVFCAGADLKGRAEVIKGPAICPPIRVAPANASMPSASAPSRW